jgi:hypothetical protein
MGAPDEQAVQFSSQITKSAELATVEFGVEPKTVNFQQDASSQFLTDIDFAILEYDAKGKVLEKSLIRLSGKMTAQQVANLTSKTLSAKQTIPLKVGATTLVLGVDQISGRFGRVEVPLGKPYSSKLRKARLQGYLVTRPDELARHSQGRSNRWRVTRRYRSRMLRVRGSLTRCINAAAASMKTPPAIMA